MTTMRGKEQARTAYLAARIKKAKAALRLVDTFAWSMIHGDTPECERELMRRITAIRECLKTL